MQDEKKLHVSLRVPRHPAITSLPQSRQVRGRKLLQLLSLRGFLAAQLMLHSQIYSWDPGNAIVIIVQAVTPYLRL